MSAPSGPERLGVVDAGATAVVVGGLAGFTEVAETLIRRDVLGRALLSSDEVVWMTPLMTALVVLIAVGAVAAVAAARGRTPSRRAVWGTSLGLAALSLFWLFPRLHPAAGVLLAAGVGFQGAKLVPRFTGPGRRLLRAGAMLVVMAIAGLGVGRALLRRATEHRELAALPPAPAGAPNVLLLILDTVRALELSAYGYDRPTTPSLERLAARGVRFARAISPAPWTRPAHASIFTGRNATDLSADWERALDDEYPTLAERLAAAGYATGGFTANVWYAGRPSGLGRGFLHFEDYPVAPAEIAVSASLTRRVWNWLADLRGIKDDLPARKWAPDMNRSLLRWLDRVPARPFFAFVNYYDAHSPYLRTAAGPDFADAATKPVYQLPDQEGPGAPNPEAVAVARDRYDAAIRYLDDHVGRLLDSLAARGILEHTVVVVTSDHGEEFYEHGVPEHGNTLYRQALEVPLIISYPKALASGAVVETPVSTRQLPATLVQLAGLDAGSPFPGPSLTALAKAGSGAAPGLLDADPGPLYSEVRHARGLPAWYPVSRGDLVSVVRDGWHAIRNGDGTLEIYDFTADPDERTDLAPSASPDVVSRLMALLDSARSPAP